jgi:hypothetical protein
VKPEELLDQVHDRDSFIAFVEALADEREDAQNIERDNPQTYMLDGAHNWKNADIGSFLYASLAYFGGPCDESDNGPTWKLFAEFLYCGKIIE